MAIWHVRPDPDHFRSFTPSELTPSEILERKSVFNTGKSVIHDWTPIRATLFDYSGEDSKPIGDFASFGGTVPLVISKKGVDLLSPLIEKDIEILDLQTDSGTFYLLNVFAHDCLNISKSSLRLFSSGRIMGVDKYVFKAECIENHHIFRVPQEIMSRIFVDAAFRELVYKHKLQGLNFHEISQH